MRFSGMLILMVVTWNFGEVLAIGHRWDDGWAELRFKQFFGPEMQPDWDLWIIGSEYYGPVPVKCYLT